MNDAQSFIQSFKNKIQDCHVLVIGDVMIDQYYYGDMKRISPEAPVPIVNTKKTKRTLGGAANVAHNLAKLGCKVSLAGAVGSDKGKYELFDMLESKGIDGSGMITDQRCTTTKTRIISGNQQILRIDQEEKMNISDAALQQFEGWFLYKLKNEPIHSIIISDYEKGFCREELCHKVISLANQFNIPTIIDPKGKEWNKYSDATIVTPNLKELGDILAMDVLNTDEVINEYGPMLRQQYNFNYLLITRSERGMSVVSEDQMVHIPTVAKEVYDVSGAGDTVVSILAAFMGIGAPVEDAVKISNLAAGIVVGKVGTYAVSEDELLQQLERISKQKHSDKIFFNEEYKSLIRNWRANGNKIIFTNGCFDLLHIGHATYLKQAKELGDKLVIGLNSDHSVKNLKGPGRPILNENDRAHMLSFFEFVDAVILFDGDTPNHLISEIRPDVLVKGGDYTAENVVGREFAGEVKIISLVDGYSTSAIIEKISNERITL